jgi:hypothetical protein
VVLIRSRFGAFARWRVRGFALPEPSRARATLDDRPDAIVESSAVRPRRNA